MSNETTLGKKIPGVIANRFVSNASEWRGKHKEAEEAIKRHIPDLQAVSIAEGTRGRPVDSIFVLVDSVGEHNSKKKLTRRIEGLLKTLFNLVIDYRVVSIQ